MKQDRSKKERAGSDWTRASDPTGDQSTEFVGYDSRPDESAPLAGKRLGHYRLIEEIGHGGQGFVYRAEDDRIRREVALKILSQGRLSTPAARLRFSREAETAGRLDHPGIARIFELGEDEGIVFIAMELVKGTTLAGLIESKRMELRSSDEQTLLGGDPAAAMAAAAEPESDRISRNSNSTDRDMIARMVLFVESAARALHAAHAKGLVHRDVKPGNLMIREDGSACVLDFGLAQDDSEAAITLTRSGDLLGTPAYMSPEQLLSSTKLDCRTDIYSLAVCLYEACTLERPFRGNTNHELFEAIVRKEPIPPRRLNDRIPRDLEAIILTAIDKDRDRRYQDAEAFADDLRRLRKFEPVLARPAGPLVRASRWVRRNLVVASSALLVILVLLVATVVSYLKGEEARRALEEKTLALEAAERERTAKEAEWEKSDRLADFTRLKFARREAESLVPVGPDLIAGLERWLAEFGFLQQRLDEHRNYLVRMAEGSIPAPGLATGRVRFDDERKQDLHDRLTELVQELEQFAESPNGTLASVKRKMRDSKRLLAGMSPENDRRWTECRMRMARNPRYSAIELPTAHDLVPLGPDPDSGLEEFLHRLTHVGAVPQRDAKGHISLDEDLGLIFVLVPGATFRIGAQASDPAAPNYDPDHQAGDQRVQEVSVGTFFLSKYEMTQGQWQRLVGKNPSRWRQDKTERDEASRLEYNLMHPVESVSFMDAQPELRLLGLRFPSGAEWERAARADHDTIWAGTSKVAELSAYANLSGRESMEGDPNAISTECNDTWFKHAPVGALAANSFGLHDLTGNVWEWTADPSSPDVEGFRGDTPEGKTPDDRPRYLARGGAFSSTASRARIVFRYSFDADRRHHILGLRPARNLSID